jgi:hypothetical protein
VAGLGWTITNALGQSSPHPSVAVRPGTAPELSNPPGTKTKNARPCVRSFAWSYTYPTPYVGEVYVDMAASPHAAVQAVVTLTWGPWRWRRLIPIQPGLVQFGQGGTLLYYGKLYTTGRTGINPPIMVNASVPVCAYFGIAPDGTPRASLEVNANPGWVHW